MASLEEIRAKLMAQQTKSEGNSNGGGDRASYPFWNIPDDSTAIIRFLPDADPSNTFFWAERLVIKLPFAGIKGETETKEVTVQVPCMEMYGKSCPILTETRPWWKEKDLEDLARKYWKKRSYVFQGFVVQDPLKEETAPENPIRRFIINSTIFTNIKGSLMDPEMEDLPTDYNAGVDFRLTKTKKGQYADYATSTWSRKSRPLDENERAAIEKHGLHDLKSFLPKEPTDAEVEIIKQMFQDSVDGLPYDTAKYGQYFRPAGVQYDNSNKASTASTTPPVSRPAPVAAANVPFDTDEEDDASDALARLKARTNASRPTESAPAASSDGEKQDASKILEILRNRNKDA